MSLESYAGIRVWIGDIAVQKVISHMQISSEVKTGQSMREAADYCLNAFGMQDGCAAEQHGCHGGEGATLTHEPQNEPQVSLQSAESGSKALILADHLELYKVPTARESAAELRRLHQFELAYNEWAKKTEWVQETAQAGELGMHRADVMRQRIEKLVAEVKALKGR